MQPTFTELLPIATHDSGSRSNLKLLPLDLRPYFAQPDRHISTLAVSDPMLGFAII